jgi:hypothetical protein
MLKALLLILLVMSSVVLAQTGENTAPREFPQAIKLGEFEKATNGYVKMKMDAFFTELSNNPSAEGYVINYGTIRDVAKREKQVRNSIVFRNYGTYRITIVRGGNRKIVKTELWLVPLGAEAPTPTLEDKKTK